MGITLKIILLHPQILILQIFFFSYFFLNPLRTEISAGTPINSTHATISKKLFLSIYWLQIIATDNLNLYHYFYNATYNSRNILQMIYLQR